MSNSHYGPFNVPIPAIYKHGLKRGFLLAQFLLLLVMISGAQVHAQTAATGSLTIIKSASPQDGADFTFDLSATGSEGTAIFIGQWGGRGSGEG
jgi:hypothetical protein